VVDAQATVDRLESAWQGAVKQHMHSWGRIWGIIRGSAKGDARVMTEQYVWDSLEPFLSTICDAVLVKIGQKNAERRRDSAAEAAGVAERATDEAV
jgi:hypothetical protein